MKVRNYIEKIVEKGRPEDMEKLSEMLDELICELKITKPALYEHKKRCLYEMAYGKVLTESMAEDLVNNMRPYHLHWTLDQTNKVKREHGIPSSVRDLDFFVVMNSAYNDYRDLFGEDVDKYVRYSTLFILDEDYKENKVYNYFIGMLDI